jgi:hypothetical protein
MEIFCYRTTVFIVEKLPSGWAQAKGATGREKFGTASSSKQSPTSDDSLTFVS